MPDPSGIQEVNEAAASGVAKRRTAPVATSTLTRCAVPLSPLRTAAARRSPDGDHDGAMKKPGARISGSRTAINARTPDPSALAITNALCPADG